MLSQILFAILGFDQDYIFMLYQSRNKRHLIPSLSCAQLIFQQWIVCPHSGDFIVQEQDVYCSCLAWQLYPPVEQDI